MKRAVFPGSFDPFTIGHLEIVTRSLSLFDEVIVAIGDNSEKKHLFSLEKRKAWLEQIFESEKKVQVKSYKGLTVEFCKKENASFLLRGLRSSPDFEFEKSIAQMNKSISPEIETIFMMSSPENASISSSIVRDIFKNGGDVSAFIPKRITLSF